MHVYLWMFLGYKCIITYAIITVLCECKLDAVTMEKWLCSTQETRSPLGMEDWFNKDSKTVTLNNRVNYYTPFAQWNQ